MKKLEEALKNISLPDIRVDEFKRELRHDLMSAAVHEPVGNAWRFAFGWACAAAVVLVLISTLFVLKPEVPARLNAWMMNDGKALEYRRPPQIIGNVSDDPAVQELLTQGLTPDSDREFMKNWHRQAYPSDPFQVESVEEEKIYAVRRFQLKDGKRVVVYTEVKGDDPLATY